MSNREQTKVFDISDEDLRELVADAFSRSYRHGYHLADVVRRSNGKWLCVWERTLESYAPDFDWSPTEPAPPETGNE